MSDLPKIDVYNFKYQFVWKLQNQVWPSLNLKSIFMSFMQLSLNFESELFAS